jgi:hypothetical protein
MAIDYKKMNPVARYFVNQALALDQWANAAGGGDPDETISSRLGKIQRVNGGQIPWYRPFAKFLVWGLGEIQKDHCIRAIEEDEGKDAIFDCTAEQYKPVRKL